ncbi:MAG TPA: response regulator transcription factor [Mycobacteriales bacterium]
MTWMLPGTSANLLRMSVSTQPTRPPEAASPRDAPPRILVVDDEPNIRQLLQTALSFVGFDVRTVGDGRSAVVTAREFHPDLVVLDVMLPDMDGFEVCTTLRADGGPMGVLFLTARDEARDTVSGLTLGGDDYVTKPFSLEEVVARIRAVLRRTHGQSLPEHTSTVLSYADLELDEDQHVVRRAGVEISLSPTEFKLLRHLLANAGRVLSKPQLLDHVWSYDFGGETGVVESYISYLRRKIDTTEPKLIHTVRGVGYVLRVAGAR